MGTRDDRTVWPSSVGEGRRARRQDERQAARDGAEPKYVGALEDGASESESGGSGTTSTPAPGTENTVFVGGLPMEASPESLGWYFAHYGTVLSVKLIYDKHTGQSKGYGFIVFADVAVAEMIKAHRQMPFMGKMIDVSEAMRHVGRPDDGRGAAPRRRAQYGATALLPAADDVPAAHADDARTRTGRADDVSAPDAICGVLADVWIHTVRRRAADRG